MSPPKLSSSRVSADGYDDVFEYLYGHAMTDGLPIVPPTEHRVARMVEASGRAAGDVVANIPPGLGDATVEKVAVNAVMAGCLPGYMPVIITAIEAMVEERFDLFGIQTTTNAVTVGVIINGPIREKLHVNCESGCLGPGSRSNSTIGRAIRLILLNLGGAAVGDVDKSTQGFPGKFSLCFGENEEESPWAPLHVERGLDPDQSAVTVIATNGTLNMTYGDRLVASEGLPIMAETMTTPGITQFSLFTGEPLVLLNPIHARELNNAGFSKDDIKRFFFEHVRQPFEKMSSHGKERRLEQPSSIVDGMCPMVPRWQDWMIAVAGGHGGLHSSFMPSFGEPFSVTRAIQNA